MATPRIRATGGGELALSVLKLEELEALKLWLTGVCTLFAISISGVFYEISIIRNLPSWGRLIVLAYISLLGINIVFLGVTYARCLTMIEQNEEIVQARTSGSATSDQVSNLIAAFHAIEDGFKIFAGLSALASITCLVMLLGILCIAVLVR